VADKKSTVLEIGWLTPEEAMSTLNIAERTLRAWAQKGRVRFKMESIPGKTPRRLYNAEDIEKLRVWGPPSPPRPQLVQASARESDEAKKARVELLGKEWMTLDEARAFLGKSEKSIQRLRRAGHLQMKMQSREGGLGLQRLYSGTDLRRIKNKAIPASAPTPQGGTALAKVQAPIEITIPTSCAGNSRNISPRRSNPRYRLTGFGCRSERRRTCRASAKEPC
jgi:hypothetical protein